MRAQPGEGGANLYLTGGGCCHPRPFNLQAHVRAAYFTAAQLDRSEVASRPFKPLSLPSAPGRRGLVLVEPCPCWGCRWPAATRASRGSMEGGRSGSYKPTQVGGARGSTQPWRSCHAHTLLVDAPALVRHTPATREQPCPTAAAAASLMPPLALAGLLLHGQTDEQRAERDAERQQSAELKQQLAAQLRLDPEALAAKWRSVAESATALADGLLADAPPGEESVPEWMSRRFQELGIK